jgi:hypothetical protein
MPATSTSARPSGWEWIRSVLLASNIVWTTMCLGGVLPGTRMVTALLTAALVAAHFADPVRGTRAHAAGWLFIPFLVYAAANVAWVTPVRWLGWSDWLNWTQAVAVFWVVLNGIEAPACRRFIGVVLVAVGVVSSGLALYQHFVKPDWIMLGRTQAAQYIGRSSGPFGIPNSLGVLMALLIPPVGFIVLGRGRAAAERALGLVALIALGIGFVLAISRGAWIALAAACCVRLMLAPGWTIGRRIAGACAAAFTAAAIAAVLYYSFPLMRVRLEQLKGDAGERTRPIMWRGAIKIFEGHPVLGGGGGSYDTLFEPFRPDGYIDRPVYAHCDYLNTLADFGLVGFALFFGAAGIVAWRCSRAVGAAGAAFTGLLAFSLHLFVDFDLKIPALAMIYATIAALVTRSTWPGPAIHPAATGARSGPARAAALCTAAGAIAFTGFWAVPKYRAEAFRYSAREKINKMAIARVDESREGRAVSLILADMQRAVALDPTNAQAWSDEAYAESLLALSQPARTAELGVDVARDAERAIALCPLLPEFWIRRGTGYDMQLKWLEGGNSYVRALELAPRGAASWYYQAYHLSLASNQVGPAMSAVDISLRLDPGFLLAQSLRQRLAIRLQQHP